MMLVEWIGKACGGANRYLYSNRSKNSTYRIFQDSIIYSILVQYKNKTTMLTPVYVRLLFSVAKQRDIDSLIKPVLDCLQKSNVIKNDNLIHRLFVEKEYKGAGQPDSIRIYCDELKNIELSVKVKKKGK